MADVIGAAKTCPKCENLLTRGKWRYFCKKCGYVPEGDFYNKRNLVWK